MVVADHDLTCADCAVFRLWPPVCAAVLTPMKQQQDCFWAGGRLEHQFDSFQGLHALSEDCTTAHEVDLLRGPLGKLL